MLGMIANDKKNSEITSDIGPGFSLYGPGWHTTGIFCDQQVNNLQKHETPPRGNGDEDAEVN